MKSISISDMIVEIPVFFAKGKTPMRVELQIRTNGIDFWQHWNINFAIKKELKKCLAMMR